MDELIKQGQWWWPFLVPAATGLLALLGSWVGTKLGKATEHAQWLRNEKMTAYRTYMNAAHAFENVAKGHRPFNSSEMNEQQKILYSVDPDLVSSPLVDKAMSRYNSVFGSTLIVVVERRASGTEETEDERRQLHELEAETKRLMNAFRKDLGIAKL